MTDGLGPAGFGHGCGTRRRGDARLLECDGTLADAAGKVVVGPEFAVRQWAHKMFSPGIWWVGSSMNRFGWDVQDLAMNSYGVRPLRDSAWREPF